MEFLRHRLQRHELLRDFAWHYDLKDSTIHQEFLRSSCKKYHDDPQTIIGLFLFGALVVLPSTLLNLYYELPQLTLIKTLLLSVLHVSAAIVWLIGNVKRFQSIRTHINPSSLSSSENIPEVSNKWSTKTCSTTPSTSSSSINTQYRHASYDDKYGLALWFAFILPFIGNILTQHKHFHLIICNGMSSCVTNGLILLILPVWLFITNQLPHIRNIFSVIAITGIIFSWAVIKLGNYEILPFIWFGVILYFNLIVELQIMKYQEFITMRCLQNTITTMEQRFQTQSSKDVKKAVQKLVQEMHLNTLYVSHELDVLKSQVNVIQKLECNPLKSHCEHMLSILNSLHTLQEQIQSRFQEYFPSSESKSPPLAVIPSLSSVSSCTIQTLNQTDECSSTLSGTPRGSSLIPDDCSVSASHHQMKAFNLLDATRTAITLVEKLQLCPQKKIILAAIPVNIQLRIQSHRLFLQENLIVLMHTLLHANPKASSSHVMKSTCNDEVVISISLDHFSTSLQNEEVLRTYNSLLPSSSKQLRIEIRDFQSRVSEKDLQELFDQASSEFHKVVSKSSIQYQSKIIDITGFLHRLEALEGRFGFESMGESGGMKVWMAIPYRTESSTVDVPKLSLSTTEKINSILPIKEDHKKNFAKTESKLPHVWIDKLDVLIICESSSAGRDILLLFSSLPHRCTVIYTLEESLELMYQYWNMFHRIFDVIMVDLNFTNVMEWIEDIQRLAKGLPCLPILVAIAEDNSQATTSYITSLGFQSVVTPPLSKEEFEAQVYMKYYENKMKIHAIAKKKLL